jgi:glycosyltransferase involved in cell wall biosynthesis
MICLFVHFPIEMTEVEGFELPAFFDSMGHEVYSVFLKGDRNQRYKFTKDRTYRPVSDQELKSIKFDLMVCKSSAYQTYGKNYASPGTKVVNVTPMGIKRNQEGIDYCFGERQLIKPPDRDMQPVLSKYTPWSERKNQILISASIGGDKNQMEFIEYLDPKKFPDWTLLFAGPVKSQGYVDQMKRTMIDKGLPYDFLGPLHRRDLAVVMSQSKLSALTTDPRPEQPFDPGPRAVFESIRAGTPCILSDLVLAHELSTPFCYFYRHRSKDSFEKCIDNVVNSNLEEVSRQCYEMASREFTLENACKTAHDDIMKWLKTQNL